MNNVIDIEKGEKYRQVYAKREGITVSLERIPTDYGQEFIRWKKPERDAYITGHTTDGRKVLIRRFKKERSCTQVVYTPNSSSVFYKVNPVEKIVRESDMPLVERVILTGGEIEFKVNKGQIDVCSKRYINDKKDSVVTYSLSKQLAESITPEEAIRNAEKGIFYKLAQVEQAKREGEMQRGLARYEQGNPKAKTVDERFNEILKSVDPDIAKAIVEMEKEKAQKIIEKPLEFNLALERAKWMLNAEAYAVAS